MNPFFWLVRESEFCEFSFWKWTRHFFFKYPSFSGVGKNLSNQHTKWIQFRDLLSKKTFCYPNHGCIYPHHKQFKLQHHINPSKAINLFCRIGCLIKKSLSPLITGTWWMIVNPFFWLVRESQFSELSFWKWTRHFFFKYPSFSGVGKNLKR